MDYNQLGRRVRAARKRQGMTQETLAEKVNVSVACISNLERGMKCTSLETLLCIADSLGTTLDPLVAGNLLKDKTAFFPEMQAVMEDCTLGEREFLCGAAEAIKQALRQYTHSRGGM